MKKTSVAVTVLAAIAFASSAGAASSETWYTLGPDKGFILALAMDPTDPDVLYAGCDGGVFKSVNAGRTWAAANAGFPYPWIGYATCSALAVDPAAPETLYAGITNYGVLDPGVFKSTDGAASWTYLGIPFNIEAMAVSPDGAVFAGTDYDGIYRSTDGGDSWTLLDLDVNYAAAIRVNPDDPKVVYLLSKFDGFYLSRDGGNTWILSSTGLPDDSFVSLALDPSDGSHLYAGRMFATNLEAFLFHSIDGGGSWEAIEFPEQPSGHYYTLCAVAVDPTDPRVIYTFLDDVLYRTVSGGLEWEALYDLFPDRDTWTLCLAMDPRDPAVLYAGSDNGFPSGLYKSADGGLGWDRIGVPCVTVTDFAAGRPDGAGASADRLYALSTMGFHRSDDGGASWEDIPSATGGYVMAVDPLDDEGLLVGGESMLFTAYILRSSDGGDSFVTVWSSTPQEGEIAAIAFDPHQEGRVYAGGYTFGAQSSLQKSTDSGWTWSATGLPTSVDAKSIAFAPRMPDVIYVGANYYGVLRSTDGGLSWDFLWPPEMTDNVISLVVDPSNGRIILAGGNMGLHRSGDRGSTWKLIDDGLPVPGGLNAGITALAFDPALPGVVYAGTTGAGAFLSEDSGLTWAPYGDGLGHPYIQSLGFDSGDPRRILAGTGGGGLYTFGCPDRDGDGYADEACGGTDCDDTDPEVNPGATDGPPDHCDRIDNNCDGTVDEGCPSCFVVSIQVS